MVGFPGVSGDLSNSRKNLPKTDKCFVILAIALGKVGPVPLASTVAMRAITHCKYDRYIYFEAPVRRFGDLELPMQHKFHNGISGGG